MAEIVIHTENLCYASGGAPVVDGLDLEIPAGMVFGFLGPAGAGKTTTVQLLLGLLAPTAGRAYVLGCDPCRHGNAIRQRTGALLEHSGLYPRLNAQENLDFYGRIWHMSRAERLSRSRELLRHFGLEGHARESVGAWSVGMQRRLSAARAFFHHPALVVLDEPTRDLDSETSAAIGRDIAGLASKERTSLFVTTASLTEATELCDLVGVVQAGRLLAVATPAELPRRATATRLDVRGRGFNENLVQLLCKRPEVTYAAYQGDRLIVELVAGADPQPIVSLLSESSVRIDEVCQGRLHLAGLLATLAKEDPCSCRKP